MSNTLGREGPWEIFSLLEGEVLICDHCGQRIYGEKGLKWAWLNSLSKTISCEGCRQGKSAGPKDIWDLM